MVFDETIAATATPAGRSAMAVLRLSGPRALSISERLFVNANHQGKALTPFKPTLGFIREDSTDTLVDQVLITYFQAPHSYTGEDLIEISCHGNPVLAGKILELLVLQGATLARPGEFTMRAFLNGKMDLAQAEAVRDIVNAQTYYQARLASSQLDGRLSKQLQPVKQGLLELACHLESKVEFVEEDIQTAERSALSERLHCLLSDLQALQRTFQAGRIVHSGLSLALVGCPNVGKSSLFNALLHSNRAIVTDIPGTTRDLLCEPANIEGVPVRLVDTAGIRQESSDAIEQIGMEKSLEAMAEADMILFVIDGSRPLQVDDFTLHARLRETARPFIIVRNKSDLPQVIADAQINQLTNGHSWLAVSAKERIGLENLREAILDALAPQHDWGSESPVVTNVRHQNCINCTIKHLQAAAAALERGLSEEFILYDLHRAHKALGEITGEVTVDDLLSLIFSTFCIGK